MSVEVGSAYVTILPSAKGFAGKMQGQIDPELESAGTSSGHKFGKVLGVGALAGIGVAMAGLGAIIKTGMGEAMDASAGTAQLAAGIKSTGGAAGVSVKHLNDLAGSIQGYSGQTDDSIVASEKLLLTFTNIKNSKTDNIFDKATRASADMAAKMGGSASDSAIQLGKALNDPIKGVGALSRVGVSFTDGQKKSIEAMVKSGDVAGAQSIILKELNTEFGGAAHAAGESLPGQMEKAKRSFEDLSQGVVGALLPAFSTALTGINNFTKDVGGAFTKGGLSGVFTMIGDKISAALPGIQAKLAEWGTALWSWIQKAVPPMLVRLGELYVQLVTWIYAVALPAIVTKLEEWARAFVAWITPLIPPFLTKLGELLTQLGTWIYTVALPAIIAKLKGWAEAFVAWITPMIPPFLQKMGTMLGALGTWLLNVGVPLIVTKLIEWGKAFIGWIVPLIGPFLLEIGKLLAKLVWWIVSDALPAIIGKLAQWAGAFLGWVAGVIISLPGKLLGLLGVLLGWAAGVPGKILGALGDLGSILYNAGKSILSGLWEGMKAKFEEVKTFVSGIGTWIADHKGPISYDRQLLVPAGNAIMGGLNTGLTTGFGMVQSNVASMGARLSVGSMDFASPSARSSAVGGGGATSADIATQTAMLMDALDRQARTIQTMQRQMAGAR